MQEVHPRHRLTGQSGARKQRLGHPTPYKGVELAMLIPMVAAPKAKLSQGNR